MDTIAGLWDSKPAEDQSEDEDSEAGVDVIPGSNGSSGMPEGYQSPVNNAPPANMDEDMPDEFLLGVGEEDAHISV